MVQCELCEERLHMSCEGFKTASEGEWLCIVCMFMTNDRCEDSFVKISRLQHVLNDMQV